MNTKPIVFSPPSTELGRRFVTIVTATIASGLVACIQETVPAVVDLPSPAPAGSAQPHLASAPDGSVVMSWLEHQDAGTTLRFSTTRNGVWSDPATVAAGNDWFVNWADFPSVVPMSESLWAAHWLRKSSANTYSYDVVLSVSRDGGKTWSKGVVPHDDDTPTEHGFVSLFPAKNGIAALWLDGRETQGHGHDEQSPGGGMTLRSAVLTENNRMDQPAIVDDLVCDCCQTDVAVTPEGPIAVYRDRSSEEIRDIYISRQVDGQWSKGVPVARDNWQIAGCPVNGPSIRSSHGLVTVAWFTGTNEMPRVHAAFSTDGGRSFDASIELDASAPLGRVATMAVDSESALVSWISKASDGKASLVASRVSVKGIAGEPVQIADIYSGRLSGFPQMAESGDNVLFAWTQVDDETTSVRTAIAPISLFRLP